MIGRTIAVLLLVSPLTPCLLGQPPESAAAAESAPAKTSTPDPLDGGDAIERYLRGEMQRGQIPGLAIAVMRNGKLIRSQAWGVVNIEHSVAATPESVFLLASITKVFTATVILQLAEEGKLAFEDPISKYLADTPDSWNGIKIRHLLNHTAGLKDRFEEPENSWETWRLDYTATQLYDAARRTAVDFAAGTSWQYSDQGYFLLGMIIEKAAGKPYGEVLKQRIFDPLGMTASGIIDLDRIQPHLASGYVIAEGDLRPNRRGTEYGMVSHFGAIATAADLAKFDPAKLLRPESTATMRTPAGVVSDSAPMLYGFGCILERFHGHRIVQHGGSTGTAWLQLPDDGLTVVVLTNLDGADAKSLARRVAAEYVPDLAWSSLRPAAADPNPERTRYAKESLQQILAGELDAARYTPAFHAAMTRQLSAYRAAAAQLGTLNGFVWLGSDEAGGGSKIERYRAEYKRLDGPLYVEVRFAKDGRIAHLHLVAVEE